MITLSTSQRITFRSVTNKMLEIAIAVNGNRKQRIIGPAEVEQFVSLLRKHRQDESVTKIVVYSNDGFVASSYKYAAYITRLVAERSKDDTWQLYAETASAKRSHGEGPLVTINNRAAA